MMSKRAAVLTPFVTGRRPRSGADRARVVSPVRIVALLCACAFPTIAAGAPAKAKKPPSEISIENGRKVALNTFEIVFVEPEPKKGAKPKAPRQPIVKLDEPLPPGEKKTAKLKGAKGCAYLARWTFADASDEGPIDICGDPKIVLTD